MSRTARTAVLISAAGCLLMVVEVGIGLTVHAHNQPDPNTQVIVRPVDTTGPTHPTTAGDEQPDTAIPDPGIAPKP